LIFSIFLFPPIPGVIRPSLSAFAWPESSEKDGRALPVALRPSNKNDGHLSHSLSLVPSIRFWVRFLTTNTIPKTLVRVKRNEPGHHKGQ
jgi:hypothetical protein